MKKNLSLILLFLILFVGLVPSAYAKEEVVYTKMSDEGKIESITVVNSFEKNNKSLKDYGEYTTISNLSSLDELELKNDEVVIPRSNQSFYYQGVLKDNDTPWDINIVYKLNGTALSRGDILGKSGKFEIEMTVSKNKNVNSFFFDNYMLQASFYFDPELYKSIDSDFGVISNAGSKKVVTFTNLPKKEGKYKITADVSDAEFEEVQIVGIPFSMSVDVPDFDTLTSKLGDLEKGIHDLNVGSQELSSGIGELYDGSGKLSYGIDLIKTNAFQLSSGTKEFSGGLCEFNYGLNKYVSGVNQFADGISGFSELLNGIKYLSNNYNELDLNLNRYIGGVNKCVDSLTPIKNAFDRFRSGIQVISTAFETLKQKGDELATGGSGISYAIQQMNLSLNSVQLPTASDISQLRNILGQMEIARDNIVNATASLNIEGIRNSLSSSSSNLTGVRNVFSDLYDNVLTHNNTISDSNPVEVDLESRIQSAKATISDQILIIDSTINDIESANISLENFDSVIGGVNSEIDSIINNLNNLILALESLDPSQFEALKAAIVNLQESYDGFLMGLNEYLKGVNSLGTNIDEEIIPGLDQMNTGISDLLAGGDNLKSAGVQISDASAQIKHALITMDNSLGDALSDVGDLSSAVDELKRGGGEITSNYDLILESSNSLAYGVEEFSEGINEYSYGFNDFYVGLERIFSSGSITLSEGTKKLADKTSGIEEKVKKEIKSSFDEFEVDIDELISFTSEKNKNIEGVQFVYMIDSLKKQKEEIIEKSKEEKGFFEKLMDLF